MAEVILRDIGKKYASDSYAVRGFNLEIQDREFVVLIGPSGCGKSTTLRMIAGLESITEGELLIGGERMNEVLPRDRDIAMVFQNYALYPHMTVFENMAFSLKLWGMDRASIKKKVESAAEMLDLAKLLKRKPRELSGGQRQRVALGRAIVREPKVFLFDEPLSNLDAKLRTQMRSEIVKLHRQLDTTFVYVTHDQIEAMTMADRIVIMNDGRIQQIGTPEDLYDRPANRFVAGFIGSPQMNFFRGTVEIAAGGFYLHPLGQKGCLLSLDMPGLDALAGREVIAGIRPESLFVTDQPSGALRCVVDLTERVGSENYLFLKMGGQSLTAKVPAELRPAVGEELSFTVKPGSIHLFDPSTSLSLLGEKDKV